MIDNIIEYLAGERSYWEGVAIYERFGNNVALKRAFRMRSESRITRMTLIEELRKLAGISEEQMSNTGTVKAERVSEAKKEEQSSQYRTLTTDETKRVRFRDRFPFLRSEDCPEVLKILVNDMFASYDKYRQAHNNLTELADDAPLSEAGELTAMAVENMLNDRLIWDELVYFQEHGELLGKHPKTEKSLKWAEYKKMSDFDLMQKRKNAAANISKYKAKIEADKTDEARRKHEESMHEWIVIRDVCDEEIERRKEDE